MLQHKTLDTAHVAVGYLSDWVRSAAIGDRLVYAVGDLQKDRRLANPLDQSCGQSALATARRPGAFVPTPARPLRV